MSFDTLLKDTVVVLRLTGTLDQYGNAERAYAVVGDPIAGRLDINSTSETTTDRASTTQTGVLYTRAGGFEATDRLAINGTPWDVDGPPIPRYGPSALHHYETPVRKATA